jgi:hypothetical protein
VVDKPWLLDVQELQCCWEGGNDGLRLDVLLAKPMGTGPIRLRFTGVFDLRLDGFRPLVGLRILDATEFRPQIPAPVCALHYQWARGEDEPYFWATAVECLPAE